MTSVSNATLTRAASSLFKYKEYVSASAISATVQAKAIDNSIGSIVHQQPN